MLQTARSHLWALALSLVCIGAAAQPAAAPPLKKVLRYAFPVAETNFDPAQITDAYSRIVSSGFFDAPYEFAFLASPARMRPNTAAAMPEISADFTTFTIRIKPGIFFAPDAAFKGQRRELTAQDYVYALKRHYDPRFKSGQLYILESAKILGLSELRRELIKDKKPFDYDREVEGLRALDRYTFQIKLGTASPRFAYFLADAGIAGAVAREVVEAYGDRIGEHPVGTGPFVLKEWRRSSRIVMARNPHYREVLYDEQAPADNPRLQAIAQQFKGRRMPMVDEVHIAIIEEQQPRWLAFLNAEHDLIENLPPEFSGVAAPNGQLAPNLAKRGMHMERYLRPEIVMTYFGMENPVVGGYTPEKVALRRALAMAMDIEREIRLIRHNQAIPAQSHMGPMTWGFDALFKSEMSEYSPAKARALLDMYGYIDRNGDGWREQPDGSPLVLEYASSPDQLYRKLSEQLVRDTKAVGIRTVVKTAQWPENLKASRAGKLMMWGVAWTAVQPDGDTFLAQAYGPNKGQANHARFDLPAFNALYEKQRTLPDGPERQALVNEARNLMITYMPYKSQLHRYWTDMAYPWVGGYHRNNFVRDFYRYLDVDAEKSPYRQR
jgi:ABC-type transport system substrate-binding protein